MKRQFIGVALAFLLAITTTAANSRAADMHVQRFRQPVDSLLAKDVGLTGGLFADCALASNNAIAVLTLQAESDSRIWPWVSVTSDNGRGVWTKVKLPHAVSPELVFGALKQQLIQYSPDDSLLFVQVGPETYVMKSSSLEIAYVLTAPSRGSKEFTRDLPLLSLSQDGATVVLFYPSGRGVLTKYDASSGRQLLRWDAPEMLQSIAVSPNGHQVLGTVKNPGSADDLVLMDSDTGRVLQKFTSGFLMGRVLGAELTAKYLNGSEFVVAGDGSTDEKRQYLFKSLKILDASDGKVIRELTFKRFGPSAEIWVSSKNDRIAMLNLWSSTFKRRFTEGGASSAEIAFFNKHGSQLECLLGPIPEEAQKGHKQSGLLRLSPDLHRVGVVTKEQIQVYSTSPCDVK
jgi:hypothetical protein